jgi:hypothetical protein
MPVGAWPAERFADEVVGPDVIGPLRPQADSPASGAKPRAAHDADKC